MALPFQLCSCGAGGHSIVGITLHCFVLNKKLAFAGCGTLGACNEASVGR
jgi:hypothetical protein